MSRTAPFFVLLSVLAAGTLCACTDDLETPSRVQDCDGSRYLVPANKLTGNGDSKGGCVLRNGLMPQPQQFS